MKLNTYTQSRTMFIDRVMKSYGYKLWEILDNGIVYSQGTDDNNLAEYLIFFKSWDDLYKWCVNSAR